MKKKLVLLISLIMLSGLYANVYAESLPAYYDFEEYTGGVPDGWEGSYVEHINAAVVDEEHGTSVELESAGSVAGTRGELRYEAPATSEGKFLLSFDVNTKATTHNMRITLKSPSNGLLWHSVFYINKAGEICAWMNTVNGAWEPQKMLKYEDGRWYEVDIIIDMDNKTIDYYIDNVYYTSSTVAFDDFSTIFFRIEDGNEEEKGYTYIDNVNMKYVTEEDMGIFVRDKSLSAGDDTVELNFSDKIIPATLNNLSAYCMGSNPVEYTKTSVNCKIVSRDASKAVVKFSEPLKENMIYKIEIPGLTSLYGGEYIQNSAYFTTGKELHDKPIVNADFSTAPIGAEVIPETDAAWVTSSNYVRVATVDDLNPDGSEVTAVRFSRRNSDMSLRRDFEDAYEDRIVLEYKMKAETPTQIFKVYDSLGATLDLITIKADGIYYGTNKLADYTNDWFIASVELKQDSKKAKFSINGAAAGEYSYDGIADVKTVEFIQANTEGASGDERAKTDIAYFTISALMPEVGAELITFEGSDGKTYYPDDNITAKLAKIKIQFSDEIRESSLDDSIKLTTANGDEEFTGYYDYVNRVYTMTLPQYLQGNSQYILEITDEVLDGAGVAIAPISGSFVTMPGVFECDELGIELSGGMVTVNTEITHTDDSYDDVYLVYAAYQGDFMVDFDTIKILPEDGQRKIIETKAYSLPAGADTVRAFLWDGFDTRMPVVRYKSITVE